MPRVFEYLFGCIAAANKGEQQRMECILSLVEIHNEVITDLLAPTSGHLAVREDRRGMYVDGCQEEFVETADDALKLLQAGLVNRRRGSTALNPNSSRSHMVVTCMLETHTLEEDGNIRTTYSRLNLVDLAGSERQKVSGGNAPGYSDRLREVSSINKSLTTLGKVIMSLVESQRGRHHHVPYRDSKLTYLLQDSLGGNSKMVVLACISPSATSMAESLTTLHFAQRAKKIRNKAVVNHSSTAARVAEAEVLRLEVDRIKHEYFTFKNDQNNEVHKLQDAEALISDQAQTLREKEQELAFVQQELMRLRQAQAAALGGSGARPGSSNSACETSGLDRTASCAASSGSALEPGAEGCPSPQLSTSPRVQQLRSRAGGRVGSVAELDLSILRAQVPDLRASMDPATKLVKLQDYKTRLDNLMGQIQGRLEGRSASRRQSLAKLPEVVSSPRDEGGEASAAAVQGSGEGASGSGASPSPPVIVPDDPSMEDTWKLEEEIDVLRSEVYAQYTTAAEQKTTLTDLQLKLDAALTELGIKDQELMEARGQALELQEAVEGHEAMLAQQGTELQEADRIVYELSQEVAALRSFKEETLHWHSEIQAFTRALEQDAEAGKARASEAEAQAAELRAAKQQLQERVAVLEEEGVTAQAEIAELKALLEGYQHKFGTLQAEAHMRTMTSPAKAAGWQQAKENAAGSTLPSKSPRRVSVIAEVLVDATGTPLSPSHRGCNVGAVLE